MIDERYRELLVNQIIMDYLLDSKIPYASQVAADLETQLEDFPDQTKPIVSFLLDSLKVTEHNPSSAGQFNRFFTGLKQDANVLYQECIGLSQGQGQLMARNLREIRMLGSRIRQLEHQLNSNLLVHRETAGYGSYLADNFSDAVLIDLDQTTARVDLDVHCVTLGPGRDTFVAYPTSQIQSQDVQVTILSRQGLIRTGLNQQDLANAFTNADNAWRMQLLYSQDNQDVIVEIKVKVSPRTITLNQIAFRNYGISPYKAKLEVLVSTDDYNWQAVSPALYVDAEADLRFVDTDAKWVKFRFTKNHYDYQQGSNYIYEFGAQNFRFCRLTYQTDDAVFLSKPLTLVNAQGDPMVFNQVSLEVCENLPSGTDIKYSLSFDGGSTFSYIAPLGREVKEMSPLIELDQLTQVESSEFGLDLTTAYHYQSPHHILLSHVIPDDVVPGSIRLWRNLGTKGQLVPVREGLSGWGIDGQYYTCTILVENPDGLALNLGSTTMLIDNVSRTGSVLLPPGTYNIRSDRTYWSHLYTRSGRQVNYLTQANELGDGTFEGRRADGFKITAVDPLYPYNHKLLVEGVDYELPTGAARDLTYQGADLFAEALLRQASEVDLTHNPDRANLHHFALVQVITESELEWRFLVQYLPLTGNTGDRFDQEIFKAFYQQPTLTQASTAILKAELSRGEAEVSPQLFYYIIKLAT